MNIIHQTFASFGLSLQRDAFAYLNEALANNSSDKAELAEQIAQEILNTNSNDTLSISREVAQEAVERLSNQSKREFDGADLAVLDSFQITRPVYHKATDAFFIEDEIRAPSSALSTPKDKILSKADRYNWLLTSIKTTDGKLFESITQIKNICGKNGHTFTLFGMLTGMFELR